MFRSSYLGSGHGSENTEAERLFKYYQEKNDMVTLAFGGQQRDEGIREAEVGRRGRGGEGTKGRGM